MREDRTHRNGTATAPEATRSASPSASSSAAPFAPWRLDNLAAHVLLAANLFLMVLWVLPATMDVIAAAKSERQAREEHERLMAESRQRVFVKQTTAESKAEDARKLNEENLRLIRELNERLRKGD